MKWWREVFFGKYHSIIFIFLDVQNFKLIFCMNKIKIKIWDGGVKEGLIYDQKNIQCWFVCIILIFIYTKTWNFNQRNNKIKYKLNYPQKIPSPALTNHLWAFLIKNWNERQVFYSVSKYKQEIIQSHLIELSSNQNRSKKNLIEINFKRKKIFSCIIAACS